MNLQSSIKPGPSPEQPLELCFRQTKIKGAFAFFEADQELATGRMKQLSFANKFLISLMNYAFRSSTCKNYTSADQFMEILYFESIKAESWEYDVGKFPLEAGISTYINQKHPGKLVFLPHTPVQGIRIMIYEEFYLHYLRERFPGNYLNVHDLSQMNYKSYFNPELQLVLQQIKHSMEAEVSSELYYEGKIMEILYLITAQTQAALAAPPANKHPLTEDDLRAVNKAKAIIDKGLSASPKISDLASWTNTSAAKLQNDFQRAFGSTIHGYVLQARMKEALHKIDSSAEPIYSIAQSVGCKNPSRFAELFKQTYGITPREYRSLKNSR
ncbi:AraC family transcriptional regulator [Desulfosporosinus sp. PR]|uniref:helix-turn-helix domain-containing protein n=1 Tax=Candidatus Desulfosporosinus nitrosoreducens TaxID=3401928 RepID=UPI0027F7AE28|nr:AraC family transcriptional regulator [Desulfosporosinus sp. PR]MDQ7092077.1 AraC family transcriptional regulator [Desulfosporosinus sp. PR]